MSQTKHPVPPEQVRHVAGAQTPSQEPPEKKPAKDVIDIRRARASDPSAPDSSYYLG